MEEGDATKNYLANMVEVYQLVAGKEGISHELLILCDQHEMIILNIQCESALDSAWLLVLSMSSPM